MGHTKYPSVAFDDWRTTGGYLYAVPTRDAITAELQMKLGSTRDADPVFATHQRYDTLQGRTIVWWLAPSANAYRDETQRMHSYFADRRVYPDRELFRFADEAEFRAAIARFEAELATATRDEDSYKPPQLGTDAPLDIRKQDRVEAARERRDARQRTRSQNLQAAEEASRERRDARQRTRSQNLQAAEEERQRSKDLGEVELDTIISDMCDLGPGLRVEASVFNKLARAKGVPRGVGRAMTKRGFKLEARNVGDRRCKVYLGITCGSHSA